MGSTGVKISAAFSNVNRLGIDTAPFIYFAEQHPTYADRLRAIFRLLSEQNVLRFTSVLTLTEALNKPIQRGDSVAQEQYRSMLLRSRNLQVVSVRETIAIRGAYLRAQYNLRTPDAIQIATAVEVRCDAFLTNDLGLKRITELRVLILDELERDEPNP